MWLSDVFIILVTLFTAIYLFYQRRFQYWSKKKVPHTQPIFPYGDMKESHRIKTYGVVLREIYERFKGEKFVGIWAFMKPVLLIRDAEIVKSVLVKDFSYFQDRGLDFDEKVDPLTGHLFTMKGPKWRNLRIKLTPAFSSNKIKMMFPTVVDCAKGLVTVFGQAADDKESIEVKEVFSRFTTDVIASCAFGLEINSLENPETEFRRKCKHTVKPTTMQAVRNLLLFSFPKLMKLLKIKIYSKELTDYFCSLVKQTVEYREREHVSRKDFMELLIQLKNKGYIEDSISSKEVVNGLKDQQDEVQHFTVDNLVAQCFVFFVAGFETSSTTLQFVLYELALHQDIQDRTREEIRRVLAKYNGELTYEGIQEMEYLDRVVVESLRMFPPSPMIFRQCTMNYKIPGTDIILEKGTDIIIPSFAIQHDEKYYPDPEKFDPDRFLQKEKNQSPFLPFGEGPRMCIGMRFGYVNVKIGLVTLLSRFRIDTCPKTVLPMVFDPRFMTLTPKSGMFLNVSRV